MTDRTFALARSETELIGDVATALNFVTESSRFFGMKIPVMKPRSVRTELLMPRIHSVAASGVFSNHGPQARELQERYAHWLWDLAEIDVRTDRYGKDRIISEFVV